MASIESTTKNCVPIQEDTKGRVPKSYAHIHKHTLLPLQDLSFSQLPNLCFSHSRLCFCFLESGDSAFFVFMLLQLFLCRSWKWMCLKFGFISKKQAVSVHQVTVEPGKNLKLQESLSWAGACLDWPLLPAELQSLKYCCSQPCFLHSQAFNSPAGIIGLWSSPAVGWVIQQSRGSCWPKLEHAIHSALQLQTCWNKR